jgi:hypothetical protein
MLALQNLRDAGREPAEDLVAGVDDMPVGLYFARLGHVGAHGDSSSKLLLDKGFHRKGVGRPRGRIGQFIDALIDVKLRQRVRAEG